MSEIQVLPATDQRVETGAVQFGDDWPGVFIRGDSAAFFAMNLRSLLDEKDKSGLAKMVLESLYTTLTGAIVGPAKDMF